MSLRLLLLVCSFWINTSAYNLDTDKTYPIYLRHGGDAQSYTPSQEAAYAGFSFDVRLKSNKPRILVGQPRAGITEQEESPGALYYCNITLDGITVDNNKEGSSDAENETEVENEYSTTISVVPTTSTNETRLPDSFFLPECKKLEIFDATDSEGRGVDHIVKDDALGLNMARIDDDDYAVCTPLRQRVCPSTLSYSPGACYHGSPDDPKDQSWNFVKWNETKCFKDTVEIIFVVDGSGSIGKANFFFVKEWLVNITKTLINRYGEAVRTEVLQYSDNEPVWTGVTVENTNVFEIPYTLNDAISQKEIQERIENMTYLESQTYTYYALRRTMEVEFPRSQYFNTSKKIVVVLTDGEASDALFLDDWYKKYNNTMKSFAVGIKVTKGTPFYKQLQKIANGGDSDERILSVDDFSKLADITDDLSSEIESTTRTEGAGGASDPSPEEDVGSPLLGTSITTSKEGTVYIGATGMYLSSGVVTQLNTATDKLIDYPGYSQVEGSLPNRTKDSYLGYSVVTGSFDGINATEYVASGAPRHLLRGVVVIYEAVTGSSNYSNEVTLSAPDDSQQIGSYFGASLLSVDVNGDGKDDLFVGAPLFVNTDVDDTYDEGRVFVYISSTGQNMPNAWANGILPPVELFGDNSIGARFGTAMADVGDLNLDGYHDVAIGAPLADDGAGAVYVYFGSETGPKSEPNQIIHAAKLSGPTLQYFGLSLQGNIDVDGNQYPDVFIGAPKTDSLVLLRSRSIVKINVTKFEFTTSNVDINQCTGNDNKNCTMIKICLLASGTTLEPSIEVQYNVTVDSNETVSSRRLFFETNSKTTLSTKVKIVPDKEHCKNEVLDMKEDIKSFESSIAARMDVDLSKQHAEIPFSSLRDQSLDTEAHAQTIWETGCESDQCVANLHLDGELILPEYSRNLPKNFTNDERILLIRSDNDRLQARVNFSNDGENSFSTMVKVRYHGNLSLLPVNTIANNFNTGVDCIKEENVPESDGEYMIQTFRYSGGQRIMLANTWCVFQFQIDTHKFRETAEMENITLNVTAYTSSKLANESSINSWTDSVKALYQSNLNVRRDSSDIVVTLGQTTEEKEISSVEEIDPGKPDVDVNFKVTTKGGYSNIPLSEITFTWPNSTKQGSPLLYLYKLECTTDQGKASCNCDKTNVNPFNLTVSGGNSAGGTAVIQKTTTATVASNLGCTDTASTKVMCQSLKCQITNLDESGEIQFRALLRVWTASITFDPSIRNDTTITSTLQVSAAKSNLVYNDKLEKIVLSAESINAKVLRYTEQKTASLPWEIIVASVGAFLLLCIIVLVLWKVGFFKRKSIEDIEREAKEKLDNELNFQDDSERYAFNPAFDDEPGPANGVEFDDIQAGFGVHLLQENSKDGPDYVNGTFEAEHQTENGGNLDDAQAVNGMQVIYENDKEDPDYDLTPDCIDDTNDSGNDDPDYDMPPDSDQDNSKRNSAATEEEPPPSPPQEDQDTA